MIVRKHILNRLFVAVLGLALCATNAHSLPLPSGTDDMSVASYDFAVAGIYYKYLSTSQKTCIVVKGDVPYSGNICLPLAVWHQSKAWSVVEIGEGAFEGCNTLTDITLSANIKSIGKKAFWGCDELKSVTCDPTAPPVFNIKDSCFNDVSKIALYVYYAKTEYWSNNYVTLETYKNTVGWKNFGSINLINGYPNFYQQYYLVGELGDNIHWDYIEDGNHLTLRVTGTGVIKEAPWNSASYYEEYIAIGEGIEEVCDYAFSGTNAWEVYMPNSLKKIGHNAFSNSLVYYVYFPENLQYIGSSAFEGCSSLTFVNIPEGVTNIGNSTFNGCSSLTSINIPEGVTSIGGYAFQNCSSLTSITIPESVTSIGEEAFSGCHITSLVLPSNIKSIGRMAFYASSLEEVTIPASVKTIGSEAFGCCRSLSSVHLEEGLERLGEMMFNGCSSLKSIDIPGSVDTIPEMCFLSSGLENINIPDGVKVIDNAAFFASQSLKYASIPKSVKEMNEPFFHCEGIECIDVDPDNPFFCSVEGILFNNDKTTLLKYPAGRDCKAYIIPEGVTSCRDAFYSLRKHGPSRLVFPCSMSNIGTDSFRVSDDAEAVTNVFLGKNTTQIEANALCWSCNSVNLNVMTSVPPTCHEDAFAHNFGYNGKSNLNLHVPHGSMSAYLTADVWKDFTNIHDDLYNVTYTVDNNIYADLMSIAGDSVLIPNAPVKTGYIFVGWDGMPENELMPDNDIVLTALFVPNPYEMEDTDIATLSDAVYVTPAEGKIGSQLVLPIQMKNSIVATGFQADLVLPEGITVAKDEDEFPMVELSTQRTTATKTNIFDCEYQADGSLRIICNSTKGYAFTGSDGEVALVTLNIAEGLAEGDYPVTIKNTVITDALGTNKKKVDLVKSTITLFAYMLGDANGDDEVDVADISSIASYVLGREVPGFVEKAADVNVDNEIDVADISALAYLILHPETALKAKARKVAEKKELAENAANTLYAEMLQAEAGTDVVLPIMMRNSIEATGFQLDLVLPEGVTLKDAALSNARTSSKRTNLFDFARQSDGSYRILCNSTNGLSFNGHDGEVMILTLHIDKDAEPGAQTIALKDMVLTDATGMLREESSLSESTLWVGNATGIHEMAGEKNAPIYDLQGRQVSKRQKGVYIRDGKKTIVK